MANEFKIKKLQTNGITLNDPSKTLVNNLNAELLNGQPSTYYQDKATAINTANISSQQVDKANKLTEARTISLTGDASGSVLFDGSTNVSLNVNVNDDSHSHSPATLLALTGVFLPIGGGTMTGHIGGFRERNLQLVNASSINLDISQITQYNITPNQNFTLNMINVPTGGVTIVLTIIGSGTNYSINWNFNVSWVDGTAPQIDYTNGRKNVIVFNTYDGGSSFVGFNSVHY